ncbi:hypothetical protein PRIC2_001229 [Phytophthora ramorum]
MTQDRPVKKRKATYLKRKEEQNALQDQIRALQQQLQELQANNGGGVSQLAQLTASVGLNVALKQSVEQQQLGVAAAQSLVSRRLQDESGSPVNVYIHLGREWVERRATLVEMKGERLDRGFRYVTARCQHLHALKPHFSEERFEDANGDFCCLRNEVIPFPGIQSVRKVFDAVKFTMNTLEISISEQLGHITVRDDYDVVEADSFISNYRLASGIDSGVTTELNAVAFGRFVEDPDRFGGQPYAVVAIDSVDQDDLHPYHPHECVRKGINGTVVVIPVSRRISDSRKVRLGEDTKKTRTEGSSNEDKMEVEVVMLRSFFVKICRPEFEVSELVTQELQDTIARWGDVVLQAVRRIVYA